MPELEQTGVQLVAETSQYDRNMRQVIASADRVDAALDQVVGAANQTEKALNAIDGDVNANIRVNLGDDSAINRIEGLADQQVNLDIMSNIEKMESRIAGIADETVNIDVAETGLTAIESRIAGIADEQVDIKTKLSDESGIKDAIATLEDLKKLAIIEIGLKLAGGAGAVIESVQNLPGLGAASDMARAEKILGVTSGGVANPEEVALARQFNEDAWAATNTEAAIFINQLKSMGVEGTAELEAAGEAAYRTKDAFAALGYDVDLLQVATAQNALVTNNLVGSYSEAADLLSAGVSEGLFIREDLLDSVLEYSDAIENMGLSGQELFDIYKTGLGAGFWDTDSISDMLKEFDIQLGAAAGDPASTQAKALAALGLENPRAAGEAVGAEFIQATIEAVQNAPVAERPALLTALFGVKSEDFANAIFSMDSIEPVFAGIEGRAQEMSDFLNNDIAVSIQSFIATVNNNIADILSSESVDLPGKIETIKGAIDTFTQELQGGASFAEAGAIALEIDPASIQQFESIIGNLALALADAIAGALELLGQGDAAEMVRRGVSDLAADQFAFDIRLADDGESVRDTIQRALDRGVDGDMIGEAIATAIGDKLASGDIAGAQALSQSIADLATVPLTIGNLEFSPGTDPETIRQQYPQILGLNANIDQEIADAFALPNIANNENIAKLQAQATEAANATTAAFHDAMAAGDFATAQAMAAQLGNPLLTGLAEQMQQFKTQEADKFFADLVTGISELPAISTVRDTTAEILGEIETDFAGWRDSITGMFDGVTETDTTSFSGAIGTMRDNIATVLEESDAHFFAYTYDISTALDEGEARAAQFVNNSVGKISLLIGKYDQLGASIRAAITAQAEMEGKPTAAKPADNKAAGGDLKPGSTWTGELGPEIITSDGSGSVINAARSQELMTAISAIARVPSGGGGGNVTNNIYLNQTNNTRSPAQASLIGLTTANQVRGYVS